jgi:lysophospholipase L1-like esterase
MAIGTVAVAATGLTTIAISAPTGNPPFSNVLKPGIAYVSMGDSYAAGAGVNPPAPRTDPQCAQSSNNYAHLIAAVQHYKLTDVSCASAKTGDLVAAQRTGLEPQIAALDPNTKLVTLLIGGDNGNIFSETLKDCLEAAARHLWFGTPCKDAYGDSIADEIHQQTYPSLVAAYQLVRKALPRAVIAVLNYPWILPAKSEACPELPLAPGDIPYARSIQAALNDDIAKAAAQAKVTLVDVAAASAGHDVCRSKDDRWIEPLLQWKLSIPDFPVHPNAAGERGMAAAVRTALGLTVPANG